MAVRVVAVGRPDVPPLLMPDRFRTDILHFAGPPPAGPHPSLARHEHIVPRRDAQRFLDDGCLRVVSPLDSDHRTEIELSEDQERWLEWLLRHGVEHVRLE